MSLCICQIVVTKLNVTECYLNRTRGLLSKSQIIDEMDYESITFVFLHSCTTVSRRTWFSEGARSTLKKYNITLMLVGEKSSARCRSLMINKLSRKWQTMPRALSALVYIYTAPRQVLAQALCITLYKSVEISCHSFWWSCILRTMICEVMILVFRNDFRSCPRVRSGVNFWKTLKTAGCAGVGGL